MSIFKRKKGQAEGDEVDTALSSPEEDAGSQTRADESAWALPADAGAIGGDTTEQDRVAPETAAGGAGEDRGSASGDDAPTAEGLSGATVASPGLGLDVDPAAAAASQTAAATPEEEYPEPSGTATVHTTPDASTPDSEGGARREAAAGAGVSSSSSSSSSSGASSAASTVEQRPELLVAGAFAGAFIVARILRRISE